MEIPMVSGYEGTFLKPNDNIDPNKKVNNPEYTLTFSQFIYSQFYKDSSAIKVDMASRFVRNRSYAVGGQDTSIYKNWIFGVSEKKPDIPTSPGSQGLINELKLEDSGLMNVNFDDILSPLPKYIDNIIGIMRTQNHNVVVNAVDERSGATKEQMKFRSWVLEQLKPWLVRFNTAMGIPNQENPPVRPQTPQEMELFENIGAFKLVAEIAMEKLLVHTNNLAKIDDETKDDLIYDFFVDGFGCIVTEQDASSGKFIPKRKDVLEIILEDSKLSDFSDSTWGGVIEWYTINQLSIETGWDDDEMLEFASGYTGMYGNPEEIDTSVENGSYGFNGFRVPVLHSFWKSIDSEYYTIKEGENGSMTFYEPYRVTQKGINIKPKVYNDKDKKTTRTDIRRLYHGKWPIGSNKVFDYGIVTNTPYNFEKNDVEFPIQLFRMKGKPKVESMIPIEDQIYLTFIKTQNAIAVAKPPGVAVEWSSLQNLRYGKKKLHPFDALKIYNLKGDFFYKMSPNNIPGNNAGRFTGTPIQELRGGLGTAIADGISALEYLYKQLDIMTGLDSLSMANVTPNSGMGKGVTEMAVSATSNSLRPIYNGYLTLKLNADRVVLWEVQAMLSAYSEKDIEKCPYYHALGKSYMLALLASSKYPITVYGLDVEAQPSNFEKQSFLAAAQAALAGGKNGIPAITFSEYSFIVRYLSSKNSIKYLELWMAKKEQDRALKEQQTAQANSKYQTDKEKEVAAEKAKQEEDLYALKSKLVLEEIHAKGEEDRQTLAVQIQLIKNDKIGNITQNIANN